MAELTEVTCPLCLLSDEAGAMVAVALERTRFAQLEPILICRSCAYAIARAVRKTGELPPLREITDAS
jgi:hypothetical protein